MKFSFNKKDEKILKESDNSENINTIKTDKKVSHTTLTPDEILAGFSDNSNTAVKESGALDMLKKRIQSAAEDNKTEDDKSEFKKVEIKTEIRPKKTETVSGSVFSEFNAKKEEPQKPQKSLFDKCLPYITDDDGNEADLNSEPLYKLQTVAEILKSDSEKALERLSKNYDVLFDDLGYQKPKAEENIPPASNPEKKTGRIESRSASNRGRRNCF